MMHPERSARRDSRSSGSGGRRIDRHYHIDTSLRCNNRCVFCLEGSHAGSGLERTRKFFGRDYVTREVLSKILRRFEDMDVPIMFAGGEPTLNPHLVDLIGMARRKGFKTIGLQTNGRMLSYQGYLLKLVRAGLLKIGISVHGSCGIIHDGLTRIPGSFRQTLAGLENSLALKRQWLPGLEVSAHSTLTRGNIEDVGSLLELLFGLGVDRIIINPLIYEGEATMNASRLAVSYSEIARRLRRCVDALQAAGTPRLDRLVLVDFPACVGHGLEPFMGPFDKVIMVAPGPGYQRKTSGLANLFAWEKRDACRRCARNPACVGIHPMYLKKFGWKEFVPLGAI